MKKSIRPPSIRPPSKPVKRGGYSFGFPFFDGWVYKIAGIIYLVSGIIRVALFLDGVGNCVGWFFVLFGIGELINKLNI